MKCGDHPARISRRDFLRWGPGVGSTALALSGVPFCGSRLLNAAAAPGHPDKQELQFSLIDVAAQSGLAGAINTFGGVGNKRYLLEEMGCGVAFFDYDHDGWLDIFFVNGTRLDGIPPGRAPSNKLFHNNRDGTFTYVTEKAGLVR